MLLWNKGKYRNPSDLEVNSANQLLRFLVKVKVTSSETRTKARNVEGIIIDRNDFCFKIRQGKTLYGHIGGSIKCDYA